MPGIHFNRIDLDDVAARRAGIDDLRLNMTGQRRGDVPFIARAQIALEVWRKGEFLTNHNIICWGQDLGDLRVENRERAGNRQARNAERGKDEVALNAHDLGVRCVIREEQVRNARVENRRLQAADIDKECAAVELHLIAEEIGFPADLPVRDLVGVEGEGDAEPVRAGRATRTVEKPRSEAFRIGRIKKNAVRRGKADISFKDKAAGRGGIRRADGVVRRKLGTDIRAGELRVGPRSGWQAPIRSEDRGVQVEE